MAPAKKKKTTTTVPRSSSKRPRPGLGRGLGALIGTPEVMAAAKPVSTGRTDASADGRAPAPGAAPAVEAGRSIIDVAIGDIRKSPWQPRRVFDEEALTELTDSIRTRGVLQPLLCRRVDNRFELIAGERRLRAATEAGLKRVPVILMEAADRDAAEVALIENLQREDLNVIEEAEGYRALAEQFEMTQQEVADCVGKARASVANTVRLLDLPDEVKQMLGSNLLGTGHGKVLLGLEIDEEKIRLARKVVTEAMSVRALERLIERSKEAPRRARTVRPDFPASHQTYLSDRLHGHFGTSVQIHPSVTYANGKRAKGGITIDFYDNEDLNRILDILGIELD